MFIEAIPTVQPETQETVRHISITARERQGWPVNRFVSVEQIKDTHWEAKS
jgi:hypothetical protein